MEPTQIFVPGGLGAVQMTLMQSDHSQSVPMTLKLKLSVAMGSIMTVMGKLMKALT